MRHASEAYSDMKLPMSNQLLSFLLFTELHLDIRAQKKNTYRANTSMYTLLQSVPHNKAGELTACGIAQPKQLSMNTCVDKHAWHPVGCDDILKQTHSQLHVIHDT